MQKEFEEPIDTLEKADPMVARNRDYADFQIRKLEEPSISCHFL